MCGFVLNAFVFIGAVRESPQSLISNLWRIYEREPRKQGGVGFLVYMGWTSTLKLTVTKQAPILVLYRYGGGSEPKP